jgi:hypothetical protein
VALGQESGAPARDDGHRITVEAAKAGPDDVGRVGGVPVDGSGGGGLVADAGDERGRDRPGAQRDDADPAAAGLGPQRLAERRGEGLGRAVDRRSGPSARGFGDCPHPTHLVRSDAARRSAALFPAARAPAFR